MYPILISYNGFELHTYAVTLALGFMFGIMLGNWRVEQRGIDLQKVLNMEIVLILSALAGARLMFVALEWDYFQSRLLEIPLFWKGGLVFYGGLIGATVACIAYGVRIGLPMAICSDIAAPSIALGQLLGRLGCFMGGCCYGAVCDLPWGVAFPLAANDVLKRHPVQLYEAAGMAVIMAILTWYYNKKNRADGTVIVMYAYLYGTLRFLLEFVRDDDRGGFFFGGFSISQVVSVVVVILAIGAHLWLNRRWKRLKA